MLQSEPVIPTCWPKFITAGTTFKVDREFRDYDNTNWALSIWLVGFAAAQFAGAPTVTAGPAGNTFHVALTPTQTATLNPGGGASLAYTYVERLTGGNGEVRDVGTGRVMVSPNVATAVAGDFLSPEEKLLTQLQATLAARLAGNAVESYSVSGRSVTRISTKELRDMIGTYKWIVYRQRNPGRIGVPGQFSFPADRGSSNLPDWWMCRL